MTTQSQSRSPHAAAAPTAGTALDPKKALGLRIKALRAQQQITQEELADRSGMYRTYMSRLESGQANPTLTMLHAIAGAFRIDIGELFVASPDTRAVRVSATGPRLSRGRVSP